MTRRRLPSGIIIGSPRGLKHSSRCSQATPEPGLSAIGDSPGFADIALVPQVVNAERYRLDLAPYPTLARIFENCMQLAPFIAAHPNNQPDYEA